MSAPPSHPSESGAAAVEFAISALVLFTLVFGCIGVSMAFYTYEVINQYARDASRYAIVRGNGCLKPDGSTCSIGVGDNFAPGGTQAGHAPADTALKVFLNRQIYPGIKGANLAIATSYQQGPGAAACNAAACNGAGDMVTVTVSYPYLYNIPFVPQRTFTMQGRSSMIISQ